MSEEKEPIQEKFSETNEAVEQNETTNNTNNQVEDSKEDEVKPEEEKGVDVVAQLEEEKKELQDKYIRLYSEFENFRRRTARENQEFRLTASKGLIVALLPVLDDFERGLDAISKNEDVKTASDGMLLVFNKMKGILEKKGLKAIESKEKEFDIEFHEALTKFPAPNPDMKGKVMDEIEKGYLLHDKVIRHAKVVVAE